MLLDKATNWLFFNFDIINMVMRCWLLLVTLGISMVFDLRPVENT